MALPEAELALETARVNGNVKAEITARQVVYELRGVPYWVDMELRPYTGVVDGGSIPLQRCVCQQATDYGGRVEWCIRQSRIPSDVWSRCTFATWSPENNPACKPGYDACRLLVERPQDAHPWVLLDGPPGTGKSHLLVATVAALCSAGQHAVYWRVHDLSAELFARLNAHTLEELTTHLKRVPVLALDDLGTETGGDFAKDHLHAILDARYQEERVTLISVNMDLLKQHGKQPPQRLLSRLRDVHVCQWVSMNGTDMRPLLDRGV